MPIARTARSPPGQARACPAREVHPNVTFGMTRVVRCAEPPARMERLRDLQDRIGRSEAPGPHRSRVSAAGKDGTIAKVMDAFDPQGVSGICSRCPAPWADMTTLAHPPADPAKGDGIFNRSQLRGCARGPGMPVLAANVI